MKAIKNRVLTMFKNQFDSGNTKNVIKDIVNLNGIIDEIDDYFHLAISCEQAQMKTNKIENFSEENLESFQSKMTEQKGSQDGTQFLIFKN